ncbi:MAG TPA: VOC family protein [Thermoplasmata archaeon]|nr:VOC family protein [Thermoplasmata archaeon]
MSGKVGHFEIPADDVSRAKKFYTSVFGWNTTEIPGMDYTMVGTGPAGKDGMPSEPGYIGGGIGKRGGNLKHPVVTIIVDEITTFEKSIAKAGGKILQKKQPIGDGSMGHTGYFQDSEGNIVGLYQAGTMQG